MGRNRKGDFCQSCNGYPRLCVTNVHDMQGYGGLRREGFLFPVRLKVKSCLAIVISGYEKRSIELFSNLGHSPLFASHASGVIDRMQSADVNLSRRQMDMYVLTNEINSMLKIIFDRNIVNVNSNVLKLFIEKGSKIFFSFFRDDKSIFLTFYRSDLVLLANKIVL